MSQIAQALDSTGMNLSHIDLISCTVGPGSFTGLRIGLATLKGICMTKEIPLYPVNTLLALAYNVFGCQTNILPFIDARMNEVYAALYDSNMNQLIAPQCSDPDVFLAQVDRPSLILGDAIYRYPPLLEKRKDRLITALPHQCNPVASTLISIVHRTCPLLDYNFQAIAELTPNYLRKSQAEINLQQKTETKAVKMITD